MLTWNWFANGPNSALNSSGVLTQTFPVCACVRFVILPCWSMPWLAVFTHVSLSRQQAELPPRTLPSFITPKQRWNLPPFVETHSAAARLLLTAWQLRELASPTSPAWNPRRPLLALCCFFFFQIAGFFFFNFLQFFAPVNPACGSTTQAHTRMNKGPLCCEKKKKKKRKMYHSNPLVQAGRDGTGAGSHHEGQM